jgi:hypothetical protein
MRAVPAWPYHEDLKAFLKNNAGAVLVDVRQGLADIACHATPSTAFSTLVHSVKQQPMTCRTHQGQANIARHVVVIQTLFSLVKWRPMTCQTSSCAGH